MLSKIGFEWRCEFDLLALKGGFDNIFPQRSHYTPMCIEREIDEIPNIWNLIVVS